jgi:hypothetical protein
VSYLEFLLQWYNWPYLGALALAALSLLRPHALARPGAALGRLLRLPRLSGLAVARMFTLGIAVVGLTINGALHDYWPQAQETAFAPGFLLTLFLTAVFTRAIGAFVQQRFPEIKGVRWGGPGLSGRQGRVVSRMISADYRAGRAQVIGDDEVLHVVLCKTRGDPIGYGAEVRLGEYDERDGRYFVQRLNTNGGEGGPTGASWTG